MIVYRIENREGKGPYTACWDIERKITSMSRQSTARQPGPYDDGFGGEKYEKVNLFDYFFAFISIEQRDNWFTRRERAQLQQLGFFTVPYHIEEKDLIRMNKQCAFKRKKKVEELVDLEVAA